MPVEKTLQNKLELFRHSISLRDEEGIIELYENINKIEKLRQWEKSLTNTAVWIHCM